MNRKGHAHPPEGVDPRESPVRAISGLELADPREGGRCRNDGGPAEAGPPSSAAVGRTYGASGALAVATVPVVVVVLVAGTMGSTGTLRSGSVAAASCSVGVSM